MAKPERAADKWAGVERVSFGRRWARRDTGREYLATLESWSVYQARPRSGAMLTAGGLRAGCVLGAYARAILKAGVQLQRCVSEAQVCSTAGLALWALGLPGRRPAM